MLRVTRIVASVDHTVRACTDDRDQLETSIVNESGRSSGRAVGGAHVAVCNVRARNGSKVIIGYGRGWYWLRNRVLLIIYVHRSLEGLVGWGS